MLGPGRNNLNRDRVLQSQAACTITNFPVENTTCGYITVNDIELELDSA